jgi:hypothetical protein
VACDAARCWPVKWVVLIIVVILVAPTIAKRLEQLNPDNADKQGNPTTPQKRRGVGYRAVRRFGPRRVFMGFVLIVAILGVVAYLLIRGL